MKIVLAQLNFTVGDVSGNADKIITHAEQARDELKADLVVFPELALSGYPPEDLLLRDDFNVEVQKGLVKVQKAVTGIHVILGYPEIGDKNNNIGPNDKLGYNNAALLHDGKIIARYSKQFLPNYDVFDEERYFKKGYSSCIFEIKKLRIALFICEDLWRPEAIHKAVAEGAQLIITINASPFDSNKANSRENILRQRCYENNIPILYVNAVGGQDELIFDGGSLFMDTHGQVLDRADFFKEQLFFIEIPHSAPLPLSIPSVEELIYNALVLGVRDYVNKNNFKRVLLGLSGGIDSALTLAIAVDAIGKEKVEAMMMPSGYTAQISLDDAAEMAKIQGVDYEVLSIEKLFSESLTTLKSLFTGMAADVTEENIQARCRGLLLMALSNKKNALVLSASNKSEMAVGYATLYGDMVGGFAVLKDVYKTMVYRLAHYRNSLSKVIPERVIDRLPSAELSPNQKDSDTLPPYPVLDDILQRYIENNESIGHIIAAGFDANIVRKVVTMVYRSEYKRRQAPPGPKVTPLAFGRDRRYPITNNLHLFDENA